MIETIRQGVKDDGLAVSISKLCRWVGVPRRTVYYRPTQHAPTVQERFAQPIKQLIEEHPAFGYRTVAHLLGLNKNTVQRVFQLMRWQVKKRPVGFRPRVQAMPSVAAVPNERWATDLCRVWSGRDGWATLALVMDCHSRELLGWHLSRSGRSKTAEAALEQALIARFGTLGRVPKSFLLRSGCTMARCSPLAATRPSYAATDCVRSSSRSTAQNGMVERLIRTLKEQCVHRHRFETLQHAIRVISDWVGFYNTRRPHQALGMKTPAEAYSLAA